MNILFVIKKRFTVFTLRFSSHGIQSAGKKKREIEKHSGRVDQQQWIDYYFWKRCAAKALLQIGRLCAGPASERAQ